MSFGAWLVMQRKRLMLTQAQAAERCGVTLKAWQAWEQGVRVPVPRSKARICKGLQLDPTDPHWRAER